MILSRETAARVIEELKLQGKKVVFTNGCFDITCGTFKIFK